jgi:hypothetical protein
MLESEPVPTLKVNALAPNMQFYSAVSYDEDVMLFGESYIDMVNESRCSVFSQKAGNNAKFERVEATGEAPKARKNLSCTLVGDKVVVLSTSENKSVMEVHTYDCSMLIVLLSISLNLSLSLSLCVSVTSMSIACCWCNLYVGVSMHAIKNTTIGNSKPLVERHQCQKPSSV